MNWENLNHAYGKAEDIPKLIAQLHNYPEESDYENEPWFSLWSSLYHQGSIYSASFAVVPELVALIKKSPEKVTPSFFALPASIEIVRYKQKFEVSVELITPYKNAILELGKCA